MLPVDCVVAKNIETAAEKGVVPIDRIPTIKMGLDIGPATIDQFAAAIDRAGTIVWNGPMGVFEKDAFATGTIEIAKAVANATDEGAVSIVGGGDSVSAIMKARVANRITHISTGGGASLEFLEGKTLPGVAALKDKD
jgi:phosphoglycerate kinase